MGQYAFVGTFFHDQQHQLSEPKNIPPSIILVVVCVVCGMGIAMIGQRLPRQFSYFALIAPVHPQSGRFADDLCLYGFYFCVVIFEAGHVCFSITVVCF